MPKNQFPVVSSGLEIILTGDGSHTLYSTQFRSTYHSIHGAITESKHVFIRTGLDYCAFVQTKETIHVLETGFGTGLNALLSLNWAVEKLRKLDYYTLEKHPIDLSIAERLNFPDMLGEKQMKTDFLLLHKTNWEDSIEINPFFTFTKSCHDLLSTDFQDRAFDLIFYDPFDFGSQPELWSRSLLEKLYRCLAPHGVLVTYGAKGSFKRDLRSIGFLVQSLPGPPGKREITRCVRK